MNGESLNTNKINENSTLIMFIKTFFFQKSFTAKKELFRQKPFFGITLKALTTFQMQMGEVKGQAGEEDSVIQFQ